MKREKRIKKDVLVEKAISEEEVEEEDDLHEDDDDDFKPKKKHKSKKSSTTRKKKDIKQPKITNHFTKSNNDSSTKECNKENNKNIENNQDSSSLDKPVHPFFTKGEELIKKRKKKEENQKALQDQLQSGKLPEMFKSKEERDAEFVEKLQDELRQEIIKSCQDHSAMSTGKVIHPFFQLKSNNNNSSSNNDNINNTINSTKLNDKLYHFVEFPDSTMNHVGYSDTKDWSHSNEVERSKLLTSFEILDSMLLFESNSLIPNFKLILNEIDKQLDSINNSSQQQVIDLNCESNIIDLNCDSNIPIIDIDTNNSSLNDSNRINNSLNKLFNLIIRENIQISKDNLINMFNQFKDSVNSNSNSISNISKWSDKYFTIKFNEIFSTNNKFSNMDFSEWMESWCVKDQQRYNSSKKKRSKSDHLDLNSAILMVGPIGCGKTALIYSFSKQFSYQVLEVNSSTKRSGKHIMEILGEATQSKSLGIFKEDILESIKQQQQPSTPSKKRTRSSSNLTFKNMNDSNDNSSNGATLALFEEIDILFDDDKGFINALSTLINNSKIPIILTCNEITPSITKLIEQNSLNVLAFQSNGVKEILLLIYFILILENKEEQLLNREQINSIILFIKNNNNDIRFCLNNLQFILNNNKSINNNINFYQFSDISITNNYDNNSTKQNNQLILNQFARDINIDIYFSNYIDMFKSENIITPTTITESEITITTEIDQEYETLEDLWKVSNDISFCDILYNDQELEIGYLNEDFDSEIYEIDENSPTILQPIPFLYYFRKSNYLLPLVESVGSLEKIVSFISNQSLSLNRKTNLQFFKPTQLSQYSNIERVINVTDNNQIVYQEILYHHCLLSNSNHSYSKMILEYQPFLKLMCEFENDRKLNNPKRGNRFNHYLNIDENQSNVIIQHGLTIDNNKF